MSGLKDYEKFKPKEISVKERPTMIVGMCPGKVQKSIETSTCWEGNRSADLVARAIGDRENIILTNATNIYTSEDISLEMLVDGLEDLKALIEKHAPKKIICLGEIAFKQVAKLSFSYKIVKLHHPSYILRFSRGVENYIEKLRYHLDSEAIA